ncbi:MAG: hypothetical protein IV090_20230 [Candidatus Sericytochromatia bacterium]|nr:hypothetical protein [Candidatus Sericytochromatia bacterium]
MTETQSPLLQLWYEEDDLMVWEKAESYYDLYFYNDQQRQLEKVIETVPQILTQANWQNYDWYTFIHDVILPWYSPAYVEERQREFCNANPNHEQVNQKINHAIAFCQRGIQGESDIRQAIELVKMKHIAAKTATAILTVLFPTEFCVFSKFTDPVLQKLYQANLGPLPIEDTDKAVKLIHIVREKQKELSKLVDKDTTWIPTPRKIEKVLFAMRDDDPNLGIHKLKTKFLEQLKNSHISSLFPYFIARVFHQIENMHDRVEAMIVSNILSSFLHYLASISVMEYLYSDFQSQELNNELFNQSSVESFAKKLSIGSYNRCARTLFGYLKEKNLNLIVPNLIQSYFEQAKLDYNLNKLIERRNKVTKNNLVMDEMKADLTTYKLDMIRLLTYFNFLSEYPVFVLELGSDIHKPYLAMGWGNLEYSDLPFELPLPKFEDAQANVVLCNKQQKRSLSLYPFYTYGPCSKKLPCQKPHLYYLHQINAKKGVIEYLSLEGHEYQSSTAFQHLKELMPNFPPTEFM